ncbi:MAG: hypothetical protein SFU86_11860 [Pirellulaceae bacterium]|nr:hypothetical protein [Pirellulaceae bacterium]
MTRLLAGKVRSARDYNARHHARQKQGGRTGLLRRVPPERMLVVTLA